MGEYSPITKTCRDCHATFTVGVDEQAFFARLAHDRPDRYVALPARCPRCRAARRAVVDDGQADRMTCIACGAEFTFTAREKAHFARLRFAAPLRCPPCRDARRAGHSSNG